MTSPTFAELGVPTSICQALDSRGITSPFAIQAATIVDAMDGRDVLSLIHISEPTRP